MTTSSSAELGAARSTWRERHVLSTLTEWQRRPRLGAAIAIMVAAGAVGAASSQLDLSTSLRVAIGVPFVLLMLRFPYALLLAWTVTDVFMGSALPILSGNNLDTALTIPTLLLLFTLPVGRIVKRMPALAVLSVYLLWALASITLSPLDTSSFLKLWTLYVDYAAVAILTIHLLSTRERAQQLIDVFLAVATFVSVWGIYTFLHHQYGVLDVSTGEFRSTATFTSAPGAALFLSLSMPLALYRAFTARSWRRAMAFGVCLLVVIEIGLTLSRGAILSVPLGIGVMALSLPAGKTKRRLLTALGASALIAVVVAFVGDFSVFARFSNGDIGTFNGRTYLWTALLSRFDPTQLLGNGLQASDVLLTKLDIGGKGFVATGSIANSASNLYVGTLFDHGIVGLALLVCTFLSLIVGVMRRMRTADADYRVLLAAVLAVIVSTLVQSVEQNDFWDQAIGLYFWMIMALPYASCWLRGHPYADSAPLADTGVLTGDGDGNWHRGT